MSLLLPHPRFADLHAERPRAVAAWHVAWVLMVAAVAAIVLAVFGRASGPILLALAAGAAPGVAGAVWRPAMASGLGVLVALWAAAAFLAAALCGGLGGPLALWLLMPLAAALAMGGLWREGAVGSFAALALLGVIQAGGRAAAAPETAVALVLGIAGAAAALAAGAAAAMLQAQSAGGAVEAVSAEPEEGSPLRAELAAAQAAQAAAEADARGKMRFLANVSHELRTPLNAIMGFSDIMRTRLFGDLTPRYVEYAELIHESGAHLLDLINDVLDVSKIEADKYVLSREAFDAREAVNAALRILRQSADDAGLQLRGVSPASEVEVDADRRALKQIVLNLVGNAMKFTPPGGSVTVTTRVAAGALEIVVADSGVGIAPEDLARLGRPYEQAGEAADRVRGTGLGLSLVKALARLHGGDLELESRLGEGTAATVRLPVLLEALSPADPIADPPAG